ncbi:MAG TPA: polysaccharide deacetylase family protein [Planctomycetota bacterium]|nr:polysaccharide deacetylase family protein [Planctomycetota bacterium]
MSLYLPILMYHQIGVPAADHKPDLFVPAERFREHLKCLTDMGFRGIGPDAVVAALTGTGAKLPERPVLLTFDDASAPAFAPVIEALAAAGFPATAYFVAGDEEALPSRTALSAYVQAGVTIGSHCLTHRPLTSLSDEAVRAELVDSRFRLEAAAGGPVEHLAYPFGSYGSREKQIAREAGYRTAVSTRRGNRHRPGDIFCLRRVPVRPDTDCRKLARYLGAVWHCEHVVKETLRLERRGGK